MKKYKYYFLLIVNNNNMLFGVISMFTALIFVSNMIYSPLCITCITITSITCIAINAVLILTCQRVLLS
jgi:hypothetical protein